MKIIVTGLRKAREPVPVAVRARLVRSAILPMKTIRPRCRLALLPICRLTKTASALAMSNNPNPVALQDKAPASPGGETRWGLVPWRSRGSRQEANLAIADRFLNRFPLNGGGAYVRRMRKPIEIPPAAAKAFVKDMSPSSPPRMV